MESSKNLRKVAIIIICCTFVYLTGLSILDYIVWYKNLDRKHSQWNDKGPINYSPIYFMYIVIMSFEIQFALMALHVGLRFSKLNDSIEQLSRSNALCDYFRRDLGLGTNSWPISRA